MKSIVKKVTDHEYVLKRRHLEVGDYQTYLKYTIALDKLLGARLKSLLEKQEKVSKDLGDMLHAIQKTLDNHIIYIFDRAVRRFPEEEILWNDYIAFLQVKDNGNALNAVFGKALALYPKKVDYWLQAAVHELEANSNVHSARITLQRGLRANPTSSKLWLRYFELELWNALRATERQKALEITEDYEALQGAPMVVFNHALAAVTEVDAVLEIYTACETVGGDFAAQMKGILVEKHGHRAEVWQHLALSPLRQVQAGADLNAVKEAEATQGSTKNKRKLSDVDGEKVSIQRVDEIVTGLAQALNRAVEVLAEGRTVTLDRADQAVSPAEYTLVTVRTLHTALTEAAEIFNGMKDTTLAAWVAQQRTQEGAAKPAAATPAAKKKKGDKKAETADSSDSDSASSAALLASALSALLAHVSDLLGDDASATMVSPVLSLAQAVRHQVHALVTVLADAAVVDGLPAALAAVLQRADVLSIDSLADWVNATVPALLSQFQASGSAALRGPAAKERAELVDAFCVPVSALLEAVSPEDTGASVLSSLLSAAMVLVTTHAGSDLAKQIFTTAHASGDAQLIESVTSTLRELIGQPISALSHRERGEWCSFYLALLQAPEAASATERLAALKSAFEWIDRTARSKPQLFHGPDMRDFYTQVLEGIDDCGANVAAVAASAVLATSAVDRPALEFQREVAEKALVACPTEAAFWSSLERAQQQLGDLKGATHTRWRRDKALSTA